MLKREDFLKERISASKRELFDQTIQYMLQRRIIIINYNDKSVFLRTSQETLQIFEASIIWPMVDSYYITLLFALSLTQNKNVEASLIQKRIQWLGESLYLDKTLFFFESCNQESIKNAVNTFLEMKVLQRNSVFINIHPNYQDEKKLEALLAKVNNYRMQVSSKDILNADNVTSYQIQD